MLFCVVLHYIVVYCMLCSFAPHETARLCCVLMDMCLLCLLYCVRVACVLYAELWCVLLCAV